MTEYDKTVINKIPPHDINAEQAYLSVIFQKPNTIRETTEIGMDDFYRSSHNLIFQAMVSLYEDGEEIDLITVSKHLKSYDVLEKVGGQDYLYEIAFMDATPAMVSGYAKIIKECSTKRHIINSCQSIIQSAYQDLSDPESLKSKITD